MRINKSTLFNKNSFRLLIAAIFLFLAIRILCHDNYISLFKEISLLDLLVAMLISFMLSFSGGYILKFILQDQYQARISFIDTCTIRLMMNFWSFIIPIRGGLLYILFFLNSKYKIKISEGASTNIFVYIVSFTFSGLFGLYYTISNGKVFSIETLVSLLFVLNIFLLRGANALFQKLPTAQFRLFHKLKLFLNTLVINSNRSFRNIKTTGIVFFLIVVRYFFQAGRYYWAAVVFGIDISFTTAMVLAIIIEMNNMIFRISPGNLGLNELLSGGVFAIIGESSQEGIIIALFIRLANWILTFTVGLWAVMINIKYLSIDNLRSLWFKLKTS